MDSKKNIAFAWLIAASIVCHVAALLVMSAYIASGASFAYTEPIQWRSLLDGFTRIDASAIQRATQPADWFLLTSALAGLALVYLTRKKVRSIARFVFFLIQPALFYTGWAGLILVVVFPFEALKLDGEWFGERSPILMSLGIWIAVSLFVAIRSLRLNTPEAQPA
jgi:hypothetical protein